MLISREFAGHLEERFNKQITSVSSISSSESSQSVKLGLEDGRVFFLKWNTAAHSAGSRGYFAAEARGLQELEIKGKLKVPQVFQFGDVSSDYPGYIILEFLNKAQPTIKGWKELGAAFARMHKLKVEDQKYGFEKDNYIGGNPQSNKLHDSWTEFFVEERLRFQLQMGTTNGWVTNDLGELFERQLPKITEILDSDKEVRPVLLHGDFWVGNVFWSDRGPYIIDPAVYYGSREADIAFSELFSGFPKFFYDGYNQEFPLDSEYPTRRTVLNLYHLMNHANLFGGHYVDSVKQTLEELRSIER